MRLAPLILLAGLTGCSRPTPPTPDVPKASLLPLASAQVPPTPAQMNGLVQPPPVKAVGSKETPAPTDLKDFITFASTYGNGFYRFDDAWLGAYTQWEKTRAISVAVSSDDHTIAPDWTNRLATTGVVFVLPDKIAHEYAKEYERNLTCCNLVARVEGKSPVIVTVYRLEVVNVLHQPIKVWSE